MESNKTQRLDEPRVKFHVVGHGAKETAQHHEAEYNRAKERQLVPCAVAPRATVWIEGKKYEEGSEIRIVAADDLRVMSLSERQRVAVLGEISEAIRFRAVIFITANEIEMNRRRVLVPGAPFTHKLMRSMSAPGVDTILEAGCYVGPDDFAEPARPEVVEPEERKLVKAIDIAPWAPAGFFVELYKPERRIPGRPAVDGAQRLRELEAAGRVKRIEDWEWMMAEAEAKAREARKAG